MRPAAVVLLALDQDLGAMGIPVESVQGSQAERDADALERPEIIDVRVQAGLAGVLPHRLQGGDERGVGGEGRAAGSRRLAFGQAGPRRGDRQPHQARARHRVRAPHAQPIAPSAVIELRRTEVMIDRFEASVGIESVPARGPESQERELGVGVISD